MTLSWTQMIGIFAPHCFSRRGTLLESIARAIAIKEGQYHCSYGIDRESFKRLNHHLNSNGLLIPAKPNPQKRSGRYADENAVPQ